MRTLASEIRTAVDTLNQKGRWAHLFDVVVDDSTTLYLSDYMLSLSYNSHTYTPAGIAIDDIPFTSKPEIQTFGVQVVNIDRSIATYMEQGKLLGNDVTITWVFVREVDNTVVQAFSETFQILSGEVNNDKAAAVFQVGKYNLFNVRFPRNKWIDYRCGFIFKEANTCNYWNDDFEGSSEMDMRAGLDGPKVQGWNALNFTLSGILIADAHRTNPSKLTLEMDTTVIASWDIPTGVVTAPFLYRNFPLADSGFSSDFDVEISFEDNADEVGEGGGLAVTEVNDDPENWLYIRRVIGTGGGRVRVLSSVASTVTTLYNVVENKKFFRITKVGDLYSFYRKAAAGDAWGSAVATVNRSDLDATTVRVGVSGETYDSLTTRTTDYNIQFDYFRLNSGGYSVCARTIEDCRIRENVRRFGGAPGIIHGAIIV